LPELLTSEAGHEPWMSGSSARRVRRKATLRERGPYRRAIQDASCLVASSPRSAHELLSPPLCNLDEPFAREFVGMTTIPITIEELVATRARLIADQTGPLSGADQSSQRRSKGGLQGGSRLVVLE